MTEEAFKAAMGAFAAGVTVITSADAAGKPYGLTATAFCSVSKNPPLCLVSVSHAAEAWPTIRDRERFAVNFLARDQRNVAARFATHGIDKFHGVDFVPGPVTGCPLLGGAIVAIECTVASRLPAGDHDVFLGSIQRIELREGEPLVYHHGTYCDLSPRE